MDEVVDVTKRYTVKLNEVNARRTMLPEAQLAEIVKNLRSNLLSKVSAERRKFVEDRWKFEQMELIRNLSNDFSKVNLRYCIFVAVIR